MKIILIKITFICFVLLSGCTKYVPSDANTSFIKSYNLLLKSYDDYIKTNTIPPDCRYWMKPFTFASGSFNTITAGDSISLIPSFNDLDTTSYYNAFVTPLIDDSYVVIDNDTINHIVFSDSLEYYCKLNKTNCNPLHYYLNSFSTNCNPILSIPATFKYPQKGYRSFNSSDGMLLAIFVPIDIYRNFTNKKYDESDYTTFAKLAIDPREMREIQAPEIEKKSIYWGGTNARDQNKYSDLQSITGTICNVIKKNGSIVPCYVLSQDSFGDTYKYISWKKKEISWFSF